MLNYNQNKKLQFPTRRRKMIWPGLETLVEALSGAIFRIIASFGFAGLSISLICSIFKESKRRYG